MTQLIKIFYIGHKPEKRDNVNRTNGARGRIWRGFGTSLDVPSDEASVLLNYEDVWCDEDAYPAHADRHAAAVAGQQAEAKRIADRDAEIRLEQERAAALAGSSSSDGKTEAQDNNSEEVDRDVLLRSAILMLDPTSEKDYTKTKPQKPRVDRIIEITSASFSAGEITVAFQELVASGQIKLPE